MRLSRLFSERAVTIEPANEHYYERLGRVAKFALPSDVKLANDQYPLPIQTQTDGVTEVGIRRPGTVHIVRFGEGPPDGKERPRVILEASAQDDGSLGIMVDVALGIEAPDYERTVILDTLSYPPKKGEVDIYQRMLLEVASMALTAAQHQS